MLNQKHEDYFNLSFKAYNVSMDDIIMWSPVFWLGILLVIFVIDMIIKLIHQSIKPDGNYPRVSKFFAGLHASFRFNIYIRYLMLAYFDMVFISGVILFDLKEDVLTIRSIVALFVLTLTFFLPWLVVFFLCIKFNKPKEERTSFSTVLLLVDRENRSRIFLPCYYFLRRLISALLIVLGAN